MAPEVLMGKVYGKAVDWWNVGYLFYVMLVGDHPFRDDSPYEMQRKTLMCQYKIPSYVPPVARDFISKLLVADPHRRLGSIHPTSTPDPWVDGKAGGAAGKGGDNANLFQPLNPMLSEGRGLSGGAEVKAHPLFQGIDFNKLRRKEYKPPYIPALPKGDMDISLIDEEFSSEPPIDSPPPSPKPVRSEREEEEWQKMNALFEGFDYNEDIMAKEAAAVRACGPTSS